MFNTFYDLTVDVVFTDALLVTDSFELDLLIAPPLFEPPFLSILLRFIFYFTIINLGKIVIKN